MSIINIGTDQFLKAAKVLMERGQISREQYEQCKRRNEGLDNEVRKTEVIIR